MSEISFEAFHELAAESRSIRRFDRMEPVTHEQLTELMSLAVLCPSAGNKQALKFMLITDETDCAHVFDCLGWAAALPTWPGPVEEERPTAYILVFRDKQLAGECDRDIGICAQTMLLGARTMGLGGCMFGSINRKKLSETFAIDTECLQLELVIALGKPKEKVVLTNMPADGSVKYYRGEDGTHYVPKRALSELILQKGESEMTVSAQSDPILS